MKKINALIIGMILVSFLFNGCNDLLEGNVHSDLISEDLSTVKGIEPLLFSSYQWTFKGRRTVVNDRLAVQEMCTDILKQSGGGEASRAITIINFNWDSDHGYFQDLYEYPFFAIRDANYVLDIVDDLVDASEQEKNVIRGEARFLRAYNYYTLWDLFGPTPLRTSINDPIEMVRSSESELFEFIESELLDILSDLPLPGTEQMYGRANRGMAMAVLTKFYLNTKQWEKANEMAQDLIDLNYYELFQDYANLFSVENELNKEFIFVRGADPRNNNTGNAFFIVSAPRGFKMDPISGITFQSNWRIAGSNYQVYDSFIESFDPSDIRGTLFLTQYINNDDELIQLLGNDASMNWKYRPDPNANVDNHGNDRVLLRYSDILLSKAEALNEISGPTQESIDLINEVRVRAGVNALALSDFSSKEELRDHILQERAWELNYEEKRRRDLIRHGKLIEFARDRGLAHADSHHERYPIPQEVMDSNSLLEQNEGY